MYSGDTIDFTDYDYTKASNQINKIESRACNRKYKDFNEFLLTNDITKDNDYYKTLYSYRSPKKEDKKYMKEENNLSPYKNKTKLDNSFKKTEEVEFKLMYQVLADKSLNYKQKDQLRNYYYKDNCNIHKDKERINQNYNASLTEISNLKKKPNTITNITTNINTNTNIIANNNANNTTPQLVSKANNKVKFSINNNIIPSSNVTKRINCSMKNSNKTSNKEKYKSFYKSYFMASPQNLEYYDISDKLIFKEIFTSNDIMNMNIGYKEDYRNPSSRLGSLNTLASNKKFCSGKDIINKYIYDNSTYTTLTSKLNNSTGIKEPHSNANSRFNTGNLKENICNDYNNKESKNFYTMNTPITKDSGRSCFSVSSEKNEISISMSAKSIIKKETQEKEVKKNSVLNVNSVNKVNDINNPYKLNYVYNPSISNDIIDIGNQKKQKKSSISNSKSINNIDNKFCLSDDKKNDIMEEKNSNKHNNNTIKTFNTVITTNKANIANTSKLKTKANKKYNENTKNTKNKGFLFSSKIKNMFKDISFLYGNNKITNNNEKIQTNDSSLNQKLNRKEELENILKQRKYITLEDVKLISNKYSNNNINSEISKI